MSRSCSLLVWVSKRLEPGELGRKGCGFLAQLGHDGAEHHGAAQGGQHIGRLDHQSGRRIALDALQAGQQPGNLLAAGGETGMDPQLLGVELAASVPRRPRMAASRDWIFSAKVISFCDKAACSCRIASRSAAICSWQRLRGVDLLLDGRKIVRRLAPTAQDVAAARAAAATRTARG